MPSKALLNITFLFFSLFSVQSFAETRIVQGQWFQFEDGYVINKVFKSENQSQMKTHIIEEKGKVCVDAGFHFCVIQETVKAGAAGTYYGVPKAVVLNKKGNDIGKFVENSQVKLSNCEMTKDDYRWRPIMRVEDLKGCKIEITGFKDNMYTFLGVFSIEGQASLSFGDQMLLRMQLGDNEYKQDIQAIIPIN